VFPVGLFAVGVTLLSLPLRSDLRCRWMQDRIGLHCDLSDSRVHLRFCAKFH
jgi:hypothetical protein